MKKLMKYISIIILTISISCSSAEDKKRITELEEQIEKNDTRKNKIALVKQKHLEEEQKLLEEKKEILSSIEVIKVMTGFDPYYSQQQGLWLPTITLMFKNTSSSEISDYIKVKAIFIDNSSGEQISDRSRYICTGTESILGGMKKQIPLRSKTGWYNGIGSKNISVKVYIEDDFFKSYKIKNEEFGGRIQ